MSLINFNSPINQHLNAALTRNIQLSVSGSLANVLSSGYLNSLVDVNNQPILTQVNGVNINPLTSGGNGLIVNTGDFLFISYTSGQGIFQVSGVSSNIVTLSQALGNQLFTQVPVTAAAFNAQYTTPVPLVAAQGANTLIVLNSIVGKLLYGSAQYTGGGAIVPQYGNTTHGGGSAAGSSVAAADVTGATANTAYFWTGLTGGGTEVAYTACVNLGLYLSNPTAVFAVGTGSSWLFDVNYTVLSSNS